MSHTNVIDSNEEEDFDLYGDLNGDQDSYRKSTIDPNGSAFQNCCSLDTLNDEALLYGELNSLDTEVKELRMHKKSLTEENASLKGSLAAKERQIQVLRNNISSLYKTAKMELERRTNELVDVRRDYDSLVFRRRTLQMKSEDSIVVESNLGQPSKSMVNASTDTYDLKSDDKSSTKENSDRNKTRHRDEYSQSDTRYQHFKNCDEKYYDYRSKNRDSTGSHEGKRRNSPLSTSQETNRKSVKYEPNSTPRSSRGESSFRMKRPSTEPHSRSHSKYGDSHYDRHRQSDEKLRNRLFD